MKPSSAKNKGRIMQQLIRDKILNHFPQLEKDDVKSTSMGAGGEDIQLSPAARKLLPIQIECKSKAAYSVYKDYAQAATHGKYEPVLFIKQNGSKPMVVCDVDYFLNLMGAYGKTSNNP